MAVEVETVSSEAIRPSSPTPAHKRNYRMSLLDQLIAPFYVPVVLFYPACDVGKMGSSSGTTSLSEKLKISLSKTLVDFYPFAGRLKGNSSVDCSDQGALYVEARAHAVLSEFLKDPDTLQLQQFLPFSPYKMTTDGEPLLGVKLNSFDCGGVGIGVCISHKIADGTTVATFLNSWSEAAICPDEEFRISPSLDAFLSFQPKEFEFQMPSGVISKDKLITKRFHFGRKELARLRSQFSDINPTRVEAVTALIWKTALEAAKASSGKPKLPASAATHVVNIRGRAVPPLSEQIMGNLWQTTVAPLLAIEKEDIELHDLATLLRKSIRNIDSNHVNKLRGEDGFTKARESLMEARRVASQGEVELYRFSSWTRFPFYEVDFGRGKPTWVCTTSVPMKNIVILMGTRSGDGIEAWITLSEEEMSEFQANAQLLQFISSTP